MIEVAVMIEGQNGLNWSRWQNIALLVEDAGFAGLFRSDHYTNQDPPDLDSLELWVSLTWLATHTQRIAFGPLVTPVSFRQPTMTARMAAAVDDLSGGRLVLGLGAGWQTREHTNYGWDLLDIPGRFARFEEGLQIITHLLQQDAPFTFEGRYFRTKDAVLLPRPGRPAGPPILIGGSGPQRTLPLVVKYAKEWNCVFSPPEKVAELNRTLDELLSEAGRAPSEVKRSMMTGCAFGRDEDEVERKLGLRRARSHGGEFDPRARGIVYGTPDQVVQQLGELAEAGLYRVMLQWLDLDDLDGLEAMAARVLPQLS
jgi:F420-dependent oxidoreductase-like protein